MMSSARIACIVFLVGVQSSTRTAAGSFLVVLDSARAVGTTASWSFEGSTPGGFLGQSVASAGDVNGDGHLDLIVGVPAAGEAFVFHGAVDGPSTTPDWTGSGLADFGWSVASAGDVNADGYADVIIGAPLAPGVELGRVYMALGSATGLEMSWWEWSPYLESHDNHVGASVSSAGDVNGDGHADVIIGSPGLSEESGSARVFHGDATVLEGTPAWAAMGAHAGAQLGWCVSSAGDVNGDGYADVIVGAPGFDDVAYNEGRAHVYLGSASGLSPVPAWTFTGSEANENVGEAVACAGDVNGDGYDDVIVGAPGQDIGQTERVFVFHGSSTGLSTTPDWETTSGLDAEFGGSVGPAGDVNGDGYDDLIVGARLYDGIAAAEEGAALIFAGSGDGIVETAIWFVESDDAAAHFGTWVRTAGDLNGDGTSEIIVGAPGWGDNEGKALVFDGASDFACSYLPELTDGGFEETPPGSTPSDFGYWGHDLAELVTAENGITPLEGDRMLKFLATFPDGPSAPARDCDMEQLVSLCGMSIGAAGVEAEVTAHFNRVLGDAETDTEFSIRLRSYAGSPADYPSSAGSFLAESFITIESDGDPATWEELTSTLLIPAGSDYFVVWLAATENVYNDGVEPEFDGHYVDAVTVHVCDPALQTDPELSDPSFEESDPVVGSLPSGVGYWGYDVCAAVGAENGITPPDGAEMLSFLATSPSGAHAAGTSCDVVQLVSLCGLDELWTGDHTATVSALFNRVAGDADTDRRFSIVLKTYDGPPSSFTGGDGLVHDIATLLSDDDPSTWEELSASVRIPLGSQYLAIWVQATEDVFNDAVEPEFDGHYVDRVLLEFDGELLHLPPTSTPIVTLGAPFPNPFRHATTFRYVVDAAVTMDARVYDVSGRLVRNLGTQFRLPGRYRVTWDGRDDRGIRAPSGIYFLRLDGASPRVRRVVLAR